MAYLIGIICFLTRWVRISRSQNPKVVGFRDMASFCPTNGHFGSFCMNLTQSTSKSDQFQGFKKYFDARNPNFMGANLRSMNLTSFGQFLAKKCPFLQCWRSHLVNLTSFKVWRSILTRWIQISWSQNSQVSCWPVLASFWQRNGHFGCFDAVKE